MKLPYVIDNQTHTLAAVLGEILAQHGGRALDVASAYFNVGAFRALRPGLDALSDFRLLLGAQPREGANLGLRPDDRGVLRAALLGDLEAEPFTPETQRLVEDLIAFLARAGVQVRLYEQGFLHAKCYLFYADAGRDRFLPLIGIVGSSNFTAAGLRSNRELNLVHKTVLDDAEIDDRGARAAAEELAGTRAEPGVAPATQRVLKSEVGARAILDLTDWYARQWEAARDFKADLIELLDDSKFGRREYTPYDVYLKAIYEYFRDDLDDAPAPGTRSAVELAEFQEDAVKKARKILARYDGVMIADSVGMGKTWIGKKLLEDLAYHQRMQALVVCPASLRAMWQAELASATIPARVLSQEELGQATFDAQPYGDADVILIDESHNFRNRNAQRYQNLELLVGQMVDAAVVAGAPG